MPKHRICVYSQAIVLRHFVVHLANILHEIWPIWWIDEGPDEICRGIFHYESILRFKCHIQTKILRQTKVHTLHTQHTTCDWPERLGDQKMRMVEVGSIVLEYVMLSNAIGDWWTFTDVSKSLDTRVWVLRKLPALFRTWRVVEEERFGKYGLGSQTWCSDWKWRVGLSFGWKAWETCFKVVPRTKLSHKVCSRCKFAMETRPFFFWKWPNLSCIRLLKDFSTFSILYAPWKMIESHLFVLWKMTQFASSLISFITKMRSCTIPAHFCWDITKMPLASYLNRLKISFSF